MRIFTCHRRLAVFRQSQAMYFYFISCTCGEFHVYDTIALSTLRPLGHIVYDLDFLPDL